jgi:hypothetical protein
MDGPKFEMNNKLKTAQISAFFRHFLLNGNLLRRASETTDSLDGPNFGVTFFKWGFAAPGIRNYR